VNARICKFVISQLKTKFNNNIKPFFRKKASLDWINRLHDSHSSESDRVLLSSQPYHTCFTLVRACDTATTITRPDLIQNSASHVTSMYQLIGLFVLSIFVIARCYVKLYQLIGLFVLSIFVLHINNILITQFCDKSGATPFISLNSFEVYFICRATVLKFVRDSIRVCERHLYYSHKSLQ